MVGEVLNEDSFRNLSGGGTRFQVGMKGFLKVPPARGDEGSFGYAILGKACTNALF